MSLRARLIIGLVAVAATGLVLAGAITYAEQRSFLYERVDKQLDAATSLVLTAFDGNADGRGIGLGAGPAVAGPPPLPREDLGGGRGRRGDRPPPDVSSRTYGERRKADGRTVVAQKWPRLNGETEPNRPDLPAHMTDGERIDVGSTGSSSLRYRAVATSGPNGLTIAAVPLDDVEEPLDRLLLVEGLVIGGVLLALAMAAWFIVRLGLRPLDRIGETAGAIAGGDLARRVEPAEPRTEVGRLGLALNAMLGRLEEAFAERRASEERLRRFLADASHELRTPLASIRGYAELFRIGAAREGPEMDKAMSRIEAESTRMGVLVEDLLALARLDEVREQRRERVDLAQLARDAVDDACAVAPDREISLTADDARPSEIDGDPGQLRQVLSNLMRNALVHTPAGTPIEVAVTPAAGDEVRVEVRDHGPGLPTGDPAELFERFWRADPGRGRGRAGAGLGLSIVAAIVNAHGGRAEAANADGGGARFTVTLPRKAAAGDPSDAPRSAEDAAGD